MHLGTYINYLGEFLVKNNIYILQDSSTILIRRFPGIHNKWMCSSSDSPKDLQYDIIRYFSYLSRFLQAMVIPSKKKKKNHDLIL